MTPRALVAQTKKLRDIAEFAFGEAVHVSIDQDCNFYTGRDRKPEVTYDVYVASPEVSGVRFKGETWKEVLALVEWLADIEGVVRFSRK